MFELLLLEFSPAANVIQKVEVNWNFPGNSTGCWRELQQKQWKEGLKIFSPDLFKPFVAAGVSCGGGVESSPAANEMQQIKFNSIFPEDSSGCWRYFDSAQHSGTPTTTI